MRIWDIPVKNLCRQHLLGEHRELHSIYTVITKHRKGYANHPEVVRWVGKLAALVRRHNQQVCEMQYRGYKHNSPLPSYTAMVVAGQRTNQTQKWQSVNEQLSILKSKKCQCNI